jgi:hypothetical protein
MDLNTLFPMVIASGPDILMTAIAPAPEGVAKATIESLYSIILGLSYKGTKSKEVSIYILNCLLDRVGHVESAFPV